MHVLIERNCRFFFKQITRNFLMFLSYAHCTAATAFLVYLQSLDYCFHFFPWHWKYMLCSMIDIRENVVKYYTNMQLLKQKDVHVFFYNSLYFAYITLKSNPLQILLIFSRDLFLQQCKGAPVTIAHLRGKTIDYLTKTNLPMYEIQWCAW